jgi:hypothetical protein
MFRFLILAMFTIFLNCAPVFEAYLRDGETMSSVGVKIIAVDTIKNDFTKEKIFHYYYVETKKKK